MLRRKKTRRIKTQATDPFQTLFDSHHDQFGEFVRRGRLLAWSRDPASAGYVWSIVVDDNFLEVVEIEEGDTLVVFRQDDSIAFEGLIDPDTGPFVPDGSDAEPLCVFGREIHWFQCGWNPNDWASLFFNDIDSDREAYRAILIKKQPERKSHKKPRQ